MNFLPQVRETSRKGPLAAAKHMVARVFTPARTNVVSGAVFPPKLEQRLQELATATMNTRKNKAPFRHIVFYGPPGTGKTLVAKQLARHSGLDYAIMSGGDVGPLGSAAVTEIHSLFRWADYSPKGLVLFIDEAEAFLKTRNDPEMSEHARNALNALLYNTGSASTNLMMVLATNRPGDLDMALIDRIDEHIRFDLPDHEGCKLLVSMYYKKYITDAKRVKDDGTIAPEFLASIAALVHKEGFSGRSISKLMIAAQGQAYGTNDLLLTREAFELVVQRRIKQRRRQKEMKTDGSEGNFV